MDRPEVSSSTASSVSVSIPASSSSDASDVAQLKAQLERMNRQLKEEESLAESERQELLRLQQAIQSMKKEMQQQGTAPAAAEAAAGGGSEEGKGGAFGLLNSIGILVGGGLGGYVFLQKNRAKMTKDELDSQLSAEQQRVAELKAQAQAVGAGMEG